MLPQFQGGHFVIVPKLGSLYRKDGQLYTKSVTSMLDVSVVPATVDFILNVENVVEAVICWVERDLLEQWRKMLKIPFTVMDHIINDVRDRNFLQIVNVWESYIQNPEDKKALEILQTIPHLLANFMLANYRPRKNGCNHLSTDNEQIVERFENFVRQYVSTRIDINDVASHLGVELDEVHAATNDVAGISPSKFIRKTRVSVAHELLEGSDLELSEIAYATGYSSQSHFTSTFTRETGVSPGRFRKMIRNKIS
jgi:AraC-like DNA-binding protein